MSAASYSRSNHLSLLHRGAEFFPALIHAIDGAHAEIYRSEERRVGKECSKQCRSRWSPYH